MSDLYAHTGSDSDDPATWQTLVEHANEVARLASSFTARFGMGSWGYALGILHDAGKASEAFQRRLRGSRARVDHATAGAKIAIERFNSSGRLMAYALAGHHGGMPNGIKGEARASLDERLKGEIEPYDRFLKLVEEGEMVVPSTEELGVPLIPGRRFPEDTEKRLACKLFSFFVLDRMLHSCLTDADYLDTERFKTPERAAAREAHECATVAELVAILDEHMKTLMDSSPETPINDARHDVYDDCVSASMSAPGLYTLTVPTGGGKTLASMAFALKHAAAHAMDRVILAVPFTTVVEQSADVLKNIFGVKNILEHHSNYDFADLDDEEQLKQRLAIQNWDAPIIVTTNVQLFESLFSNRPGKSRKVHSMVNSVIVLDEAQTLPDFLLKPSLAMLEELCLGYGSSVVLCTATQPALEGLWPFDSQPREIIEHREAFEEAFGGRVSYEMMGEVEKCELVEQLSRCHQVLCVVGTKKAARALYDDVVARAVECGEVTDELCPCNDGYFHLSAFMVPAHRSTMLELIRARLKKGQRCIAISTQLVEAGVDVDFPEVYRELAGLDSVVQAAGRCNREGKSADGGKVHVFECFEDGARMKTGLWLETMKGIARNVIRANDGMVSEDLIKEFFERRYDSGDLDAEEILKVLTKKDILSTEFSKMPFEWVAQSYKIIDDVATPVFIPWGSEGRKLLKALLASEVPASMAMRLQRFTVDVPAWDLRGYEDEGAFDFIDPFRVLKEDGCRSFYRDDVGLVGVGQEVLDPLIS